MFLKDCWYVAAFAKDITTTPTARTLLGEPVVLFRQLDGTAAALEDRCCHRGLPLVQGKVIAEGLRCGYHGLVFNTAGRCVRIPGQDTIPPAACVKSYPLVEQDDVLWVWMGDPAKADPAGIERYQWHNEPGWAYRGACIPVKAHSSLVVENLMDLTHVGYVHASTLGGEPDAHSNAEMKTWRSDNGVNVLRWLRNSLPPPTYQQAVEFKGRVDRWIEIVFKPGILTINAGAKDVNTGAYEGNREGGFALRSMHAVTPETENTCHYFWTIAHEVRDHMPGLTDIVFNEIDTAFKEDKIVIEAQFKRLQERPLPLIDIKTDAPALQSRRIMATLIDRQNAPVQ